RSYGVGVVADPYPELAARRAHAAAHVGALSAWFGVDGPEQVVYGSCPHVSVLSYKGVETVVKDDATYSSSWLSPMLGEVVGRSPSGAPSIGWPCCSRTRWRRPTLALLPRRASPASCAP